MIGEAGYAHVTINDEAPAAGGHKWLMSSRSDEVRSLIDLVGSSSLCVDRLTRVAQRALSASGVFVSLIDGHFQTIISASGLVVTDELRRTPVAEGICRHVVESVQPVMIHDACAHPLSRDLPVVREGTIAAYLGVPLTLESGVTVGALCAIEETPRIWRAADIDTLHDVAASLLSELELMAQRRTSLSSMPDNMRTHVSFAGLGLGEAMFEPAGLLVHGDLGPASMLGSGRRHVLVADVGSALNSQFCNLLSAPDCQIDCVSGQASALQAMADRDYAMVFVDICDAGCCGLSSALAIRQLDSRKGEVPIVALSMDSSRHSIDACSKSGIDALLVVPITQHSLQETMDALAAR